jgi:hypothetical protein
MKVRNACKENMKVIKAIRNKREGESSLSEHNYKQPTITCLIILMSG